MTACTPAAPLLRILFTLSIWFVLSLIPALLFLSAILFITSSLFLHFLMVRIIGNRWAFRLLWQQRAPAPASLSAFRAVKCCWPLGEQRKSMTLINTAIKSAGVCVCVCVSQEMKWKKKTAEVLMIWKYRSERSFEEFSTNKTCSRKRIET